MLDAQLHDLIEKRRAATPGPWYVGYDDGSGESCIVAREHEDELGLDAVVVWGGSPEGDIEYGARDPRNAAFLAACGSFPFEELAAERERLRAALERTLGNFERVLARKSVRDATETIAEARTALQEAE